MAQEANIPPDLLAQIDKRIQERIAEFARSPFLRNASITGGSGLTIGGGGTLTVDGGRVYVNYPESEGGGTSVYIGDIYESGTYTGTGMLVQSPSGVDMILARQDLVFGNTRVDLYDTGNRVIVGNDAATGQGLARPYIGGVFRRTRYSDFSVSTTSGTFETLWDAWIPKQHPKLEVAYRASMDTAATTGEVQVLVDGVQLGATTAESFAVSTRYIGPASVAGNHMDWLHVEIQGRRTSATGALRVEPSYVYGKQS